MGGNTGSDRLKIAAVGKVVCQEWTGRMRLVHSTTRTDTSLGLPRSSPDGLWRQLFCNFANHSYIKINAASEPPAPPETGSRSSREKVAIYALPFAMGIP